MKKKLNIYFTAGVPKLDDTTTVMKMLQNCGADFIELGMPYSDPVADGPVIQKAHELALKNGMTMKILFEQLKSVRHEMHIPVVLMGYLNPVMQFGFESFCRECRQGGVTALIIPDLPPHEFETTYAAVLKKYGLGFIFLVTPETSDDRMRYLDSLSSPFLYAVSSSATTGNTEKSVCNTEYLERLSALKLKNPVMIGFGISNREDFAAVTETVAGAIIGSAFVKILLDDENWKEVGGDFIRSIQD